MRSIKSDPLIEHAMLFMNCRAEAGASLQHIHAQLIGTPILPNALSQRWDRMKQHLDEFGNSILEQICHWEQEEAERVVEESENFLVLCPYASRFGYQLWIVPKQRFLFETMPDTIAHELGQLTRRYVQGLESLLDQPAYNLLFHFAPRKYSDSEHWFVEIFPRLTRPAGFEWGTGWWVNSFAPEMVAEQFREYRKQSD